ncbi:MAG: sugar ABC transporter permease, partial [Clostridium sp.]|nr:sugar ABC transporter permease [Clostridium sp.]
MAVTAKPNGKQSKRRNEQTIKLSWKEIKRQKVLLIWSGILVLYGLLFCYLPLGGWIGAFQQYKPKDGFLHSQFVGFLKFRQLFSDRAFLLVIRNTLAMGVINLVSSFVMAILFAILLNEVRSKTGKKTVQTISYLPHFLSWIIVTGILHDALSSSGIVNELLLKFGIRNQPLNFF